MHRRVLALLAPTILVLACALKREGEHAVVTPDPVTRRAVQSGLLVGTTGRHGGHAWLGIPFAKPPVGALRWRAPLPPDPWNGTRPAIHFASPCAQLAAPFGGIYDVKRGEPAGSEDCLYLNVWTPSFPEGRVPIRGGRLPVMVWIHGGGNSLGHGGFFDGSNLAATQDVVVITLNYRLGPLGWFRHPALRSDGTSDAERSGNFGTLDLVRALEWVHDNVAAFGGDPRKVTIFGESAGGTNVATLLVSPLARRLFHRAILESSGLHASSVDEAEHLRDDPVPGHRHSSGELLLDLLVRDGTATDRAAAKARVAAMTPDEVAGYLRGKSSAELLTAAAPGNFGGLLDFPQVFLDGVVLPREKPFDLLGRRGAYTRVPIMLGTTRDEVKLFLFTDPALARVGLSEAEARQTPLQRGTYEAARGVAKGLAVDLPLGIAHFLSTPLRAHSRLLSYAERLVVPVATVAAEVLGSLLAVRAVWWAPLNVDEELTRRVATERRTPGRRLRAARS